MICNVVYDDELGRVVISATDVTGGSRADVERSLDQVEWVPVRGGVGVTVVGEPPTGSVAPPVSDYEFATQSSSFTYPSAEVCPTGSPAGAVENFYRVRTYYPESMLSVTGSADSRAYAPDAAALDITGDLDLRVGVRPDDWTPGTDALTLVSKYLASGDNRSWTFAINSDGTLLFRWSPDGTFAGITANSVSSTSATGFADGSHHAVRVTLDVDNGLGNHTVTFYTAETTAGPWQQLGGAVIRAGTTSVFAGTADLEVGSIDGGTSVPFAGQVMLTGSVTKVELRDGIGGTVVASPDFTDQLPGTTSFADAQANTWTVDVEAFIVVDPDPTEDPDIEDECVTSLVPGIADVWLKSLYHPFLNRKVSVLRNFDTVARNFRGGVFDVVSRSLPIAVTDLRSSRQWTLGLCTSTPQEATDLDIILASGDPLFLHVPGNSNLPVPSMHLVVDRTAVAVKRAYSDSRTWSLPYTEVAAPDVSVTGSVGTWQTVLNTYATWQDVLNAHATWADLLTLVGQPEDVIFP